MHRVVDASHIELAQIYERPDRDVVDQAPLKDKRQIKSDHVVPDDLVDVRIEACHQREEIRERLLLALLLSVGVNAKDMFALALLDAFDFDTGNGTDVHGYRKHPP